MLDIGWSEMAVIALVALVVIGPKDLPKVMRTVGQWMRKARSVSREFQSSIDEMLREAELDDAKKAIQSTRKFNIDRMLDETIDPTGDLKKEVRAIDNEARDRGSKASDKPASPADNKPGEAKSIEAKPGEAKPGEGKSGGDKASDAESGEPKAEAAGATVIKHPAKPAPPHSLTPPKEPAGNGAAPPTAEGTASTDTAAMDTAPMDKGAADERTVDERTADESPSGDADRQESGQKSA